MRRTLRKLADGHGFLSILLNLRRVAEGHQPIFLDYKPESIPRYGYGKPPHAELTEMFRRDEDQYRNLLTQFLGFSDQLLRIPLREKKSSPEPCWINEWQDGLDTLALYGFVATRNAALLLEVGSGIRRRSRGVPSETNSSGRRLFRLIRIREPRLTNCVMR